jgi:hypothetical protein
MSEEIIIEEEFHNFTLDQKIKWFGYGEWVEEIDAILFTYRDIPCKVLRIVRRELYTKELYMFGGCLSGYVRIPHGHPYEYKIYEDLNIDCHGGLTYGECSLGHWIGFDCAHAGDLVPSTQKFMKDHLKEFPEAFSLNKELNKSLINTYKNIDFCIEECKSIVNQLILVESKERK